MKITNISISFDNGATIEGHHPEGFDFGDVLSPDSISNAASDTLPGLISTILTGAIGLLMKRYGLVI